MFVECLLYAKHILSAENTTINNRGKVSALMLLPFPSNWLEIRYVTSSWAMGSEGKYTMDIWGRCFSLIKGRLTKKNFLPYIEGT